MLFKRGANSDCSWFFHQTLKKFTCQGHDKLQKVVFYALQYTGAIFSVLQNFQFP